MGANVKETLIVAMALRVRLIRPFQAGAKSVGTVETCRRRQILEDSVYRGSIGFGIASRMVVLDLAHMVLIADPNKGHRSV